MSRPLPSRQNEIARHDLGFRCKPIEFLEVVLALMHFCALTFELSGRRRQHARPELAKMYRVPPDRAWWPAVGGPLERRLGSTRVL